MMVPGLLLVTIQVVGLPAPQGSKRAVGTDRKGRAILVESCTRVKGWRKQVYLSALLTNRGARPKHDGPLIASIVFTMPRPKKPPQLNRHSPCTKPDLSKLLRSTEDALTDAGMIADDARIVEFTRLAKVYAGSDPEALETPGAVIRIWRAHCLDVTSL
jgi:Holliday junction resolvase RusA-like endonuclease